MTSIRHRNILDNFEFLVWFKDTNGVFLDVNDKFTMAAGLNDVDLIIGKTDLDIWPYDLATKYRQDDDFVIKTKVSKKVTEEVFDHERKWFETTKIPVFDNSGDVIGTFGYSIDLSEKMNFQKQLEATNEKLSIESSKLKTLIDAIPDLVWLKDKEGTYLSCNKRFEDFFGASEKEIIGKTDYDFVNKELADFFRQHDKDAMSSESSLSNFEEIPFACDGHKEYLKTTKTKVLDEHNSVIGVLGIGRDFTNEYNANKELEFQKQELETIFNTTKDGIAVLDLKTNFLKVNKAYCDISGLNEEELLATSCLALTLDEDIPKAHERFDDLVIKGFVDNFEKRCLIHNQKITVNMSLALLPDKQHILASIKDISKLKLFEEQSKLASMGEMIGNIAHQWRQPLSVISSLASGTAFKKEYGTLKDEEIIPNMDEIVHQVEYLSKTIDDFRNFIKDNHEEKIFSVKNAIEKTISILHPAIKSNNITLIVNLEADTNVFGYENEFMQSLINIINNARDAVKNNIEEEADQLIFIETKRSYDDLIVSIKDSGGGIPETIIHRIFEPYFTTKHQNVGTGIGLSMTYKMITQHHNATIEVTNEEYIYNEKLYKGALFTIEFKDIKSM